MVHEIVGDYRFAGNLQPPPFPLFGGLRWLLGDEQVVSA
jgi:hypothetical protein